MNLKTARTISAGSANPVYVTVTHFKSVKWGKIA